MMIRWSAVPRNPNYRIVLVVLDMLRSGVIKTGQRNLLEPVVYYVFSVVKSEVSYSAFPPFFL